MFFATWRKYRAGEPLAGIETIALDVILAHPEYHRLLSDPERHRDRDYAGELNPFLHMSLHLALEEQLSIDQPPGIVTRFRDLMAAFGDRHPALPTLFSSFSTTSALLNSGVSAPTSRRRPSTALPPAASVAIDST